MRGRSLSTSGLPQRFASSCSLAFPDSKQFQLLNILKPLLTKNLRSHSSVGVDSRPLHSTLAATARSGRVAEYLQWPLSTNFLGDTDATLVHLTPSHSQVSPKRLPKVPERLCPPKRTIFPRSLSNAIVASARGDGPDVSICVQL